MTDTERAELKRLAEAATPIADGARWMQRIRMRDFNGHDERFIEAANPVAVLDLLGEVETTKTAWERLHQQRADDVLSRDEEISRLKAEIQRMKDDAQDDAWERSERDI